MTSDNLELLLILKTHLYNIPHKIMDDGAVSQNFNIVAELYIDSCNGY